VEAQKQAKIQEQTAAAAEAQEQHAKIQEQIAAAAEAQEQQAKVQEQIMAAAAEAREQQAKIQQIMTAAEAQEQQAKIHEQILADIKQQSRTMSWFTVVTALFLPLSFFTSHFAIGWNKGKSSHNDGDFWKVFAPLTLLFMCVTVYMVYRKKAEVEETKMVKFMEKMIRVSRTKRARKSTVTLAGKPAETGVKRAV